MHSPGSAAFLVGGALVLGDNALLAVDGTLVPVPEKNPDDPARVVLSLRSPESRLLAEELEVRWLEPAHSGGIEGRQTLTDFAESHRKS